MASLAHPDRTVPVADALPVSDLPGRRLKRSLVAYLGPVALLAGALALSAGAAWLVALDQRRDMQERFVGHSELFLAALAGHLQVYETALVGGAALFDQQCLIAHMRLNGWTGRHQS